ncbi:Tat (twin-arginine translocation) pathway signal sequence [Marinospirillum celere]|uniref:Tat (Twin-arginine translocation) pathway signal sequence n=1 Tax=Marinospirillum celere TaxID=1122252 RepID=A0A1I1G9J0_9GAMM|nr:twin-arginine translocation signal domain-containing protein [Marinospirillum celere]SFC05820.1 Tat (twin-arginine translocation) pathway signal sequence [Marinospirillum celere]
MPKLSRRRFLQASLASAAATGLAGCASKGAARPSPPADGQLQLLFYADTHAHWLPVHSHPAANHLGPMSLLGQAPYLTESSRLSSLGIAETTSAAAWLTASAARQQSQQLGQMGGYAALASALQEKREAFGAEASLTLEGGQCWNGSGLAQMSAGRHGPLSSDWLGADVRVASEEQRLWPSAYKQLYSSFRRPVLTSDQPTAYFSKGGIEVAVVGVTDPSWQVGRFDEQDWLNSIQQQVDAAGQKAALVVVLSDAGTNPDFWLAQQLQGVDLILSSRGQDLWPQLVYPRQNTAAPIPVCLAGSQGQGFFTIQVRPGSYGWQLDAEFHPVWSRLTEEDAEVADQITRLRAPYAGWLDQPLGKAPGWLYRRDALAGSWDQLIAEALKTTGADLTFAPGLRQGLAVPPGVVITREHLLSLTGGYEAPVFNVGANRRQLRSRLESGASQWLGDQLYLHTSEDLPRLTGSHYVLRYQAQAGQRVSELEWPAASTTEQLRVSGWSRHYQGEGTPLWQLLEAWLRQQSEDWQLPEIEKPSLAFVEGHPGWHPEALLDEAGGS